MANFFDNLKAVNKEYISPDFVSNTSNRFKMTYDPNTNARSNTFGIPVYANKELRYENRLAIPFQYKDKKTNKIQRGIIYTLPNIDAANGKMEEISPFKKTSDVMNDNGIILGGYLIDSPISYDGEGMISLLKDKADPDSFKLEYDVINKTLDSNGYVNFNGTGVPPVGVRAGIGPNSTIPNSRLVENQLNNLFLRENNRNSWLQNYRNSNGGR